MSRSIISPGLGQIVTDVKISFWKSKLDVVAHTCGSSTQKAEQGHIFWQTPRLGNLAIESSSQKPPWNEAHIYMHNTIRTFAALTTVVGSEQASSDLPPPQRAPKASHLRWRENP